MRTIYLAGPMAGCTEQEMRGWRNAVKDDLPEYKFLDPCDRKYTPQQWYELVEDDIQDIEDSDLVLCHMWKNGIGSSMELVESRYRRKPTVVVIPDYKNVSPWVRRYSSFLVQDFETAYKIIKAEWPNAGVEGVHHP